MFDVGITADDHDVGRRSELIDEGSELLIFDHHRLELVVRLDATQFELLDDVGDFLEAMGVLMGEIIIVRDHEEGASLE